MRVTKRAFISLTAATAIGVPALAADKVISGTLGGQAPLWPFYVAAHEGFFIAENLDVEINFAQSGPAVTEQLTAGSLDVILSVGVSDPVHAIDKGASLALIRIIGDAPPYVLIGKAGIKSIADLKGKTISVGNRNDPTTYYFERMAAANGLKHGDYQVLSAGVAAARYAALKAGIADAAMVLPPLNFRASRAGYVTLGLSADYIKNLPFTGMAVYRPWAAAHLTIAKRLLAATDSSIGWLNDTGHRKEAVDLLVRVAHADAEDAGASYDFLRRIRYFEPSRKVSRAKLQDLIDVERDAGRISRALTIDRAIMPGLTELAD
jgi:ABC-type nitrate/sulfonate/bicarbonate transport system substrate-binding protein